MQKQSSLILKTKTVNHKYLILLNRIINITKTVKHSKVLRSMIETICRELPNGFKCDYLELASGIKSREEKLIALTKVFYKLGDEDKILVRKEIKNKLTRIKSIDRKIKLIFNVFETKDKELILHFKIQIQNLPPKYLLEKNLLLLMSCLFSDNEIESEQLQNQILCEVLALNDLSRTYFHLGILLNYGLLGKIKEKAITFAVSNWQKLENLSDKIQSAAILKYFPSKSSEQIINKLYWEIKEINKNNLDKTSEVYMLMDLASKLDYVKSLFVYKQLILIIKGIKGEETIDIWVLYNLTDIVPEHLAVELLNLILSSPILRNKPEVIIGSLVDIMCHVSRKIQLKILEKANDFLNAINVKQIKEKNCLKQLLKLIHFLPLGKQQDMSSKVLNTVMEEDECCQAKSFVDLVQCTSKKDKKLILDLIEQMQSAKHKSIALANVVYEFEGERLIRLAERILELVDISLLDETEVDHLLYSLLVSIGHKLAY